MFPDATKKIESELFHFLFPIRIKDNSQHLVFLMFGSGNAFVEAR